MSYTKKQKIFNSVFISISIFLIAVFASCDNFSKITYESENQELYTVRGKLLSPAVSKNARYAMPDFFSANIIYSVIATSESGATATGTFEKGSTDFSIKLGLGKWTLEAEGKVDGENAVLKGTKEIELTKGNPLLSNVSIELLEVYGDGGNGTVSLNINVPENVKSVEANWTLKSSPKTAYVAYFNDVIDKVTIDKLNTNTPDDKSFEAGAYTLRLYFWSDSDAKNKGTLLYYISNEIVNVFSGMETNTWQGNAEYFSGDEDKTVNITEKMIENFLHTTFYVGKKDALQINDANDSNNGTYFAPLATVEKAVEKIQETEKQHHYDNYSIYVYESTSSDSPSISENVNITIYGDGEGKSVSNITMSATSGTLTAENLSVTEKVSLASGKATFNGGSIGTLEVSGGEVSVSDGTIDGITTVSSGNLTLSNTTVNGDITISDGNLTLNNTTVKGDITYTGGKLVLEGSTTVASENKITMSKNLTISVKNLSEDNVAKIAASPEFDTWNRGVEVLNSLEGDERQMLDTVHKFTLESNRWVLVQGSDKTKGILEKSEGSVKISEYIVEFTVSPTSFTHGTEQTITVTPVVNSNVESETISAKYSDFDEWNISIMQGEYTLMTSENDTITIPAGYPSGTYSLKVSGKYNGLYYSGSFKITIN